MIKCTPKDYGVTDCFIRAYLYKPLIEQSTLVGMYPFNAQLILKWRMHVTIVNFKALKFCCLELETILNLMIFKMYVLLEYLKFVVSRVHNIEREGEYLTLYCPCKTHCVKLLCNTHCHQMVLTSLKSYKHANAHIISM